MIPTDLVFRSMVARSLKQLTSIHHIVNGHHDRKMGETNGVVAEQSIHFDKSNFILCKRN